jgi:hypothetical protein
LHGRPSFVGPTRPVRLLACIQFEKLSIAIPPYYCTRDPFTFKEMVKPGQIYRTKAKEKFGLSEEDLSYLVAITSRNPTPQYSKKRYQLDDVKILARAVHGNLDTYYENRRTKADERLEKKRRRQEELRTRRAVLEEALRGSGLSIYSNDNCDMCSYYISYGIGDPNQIANVTKERGFFKRSTRYLEIYRNFRVAPVQNGTYIPESYESHWKYQYSTNAQNQALVEWVRAFPTREAALADPTLPESLKDKVRLIGVNE